MWPRLQLGLVVFVAHLFASNGLAADSLQGEIRFQPAREGAVWVGQELVLNLDLMSTGFSFSGQLFSLPDVAGAYLLPVDSSTVKLNENRAGEAWQGLRYSFLLYPQREGRLEVPSFEVQFSASVGYGTEAENFRFNTKPLTIETKFPPGADRSGLVVSTSEFKIKSSWEPGQSASQDLVLKTGDALKLTVVRSAAGVPAMVFPPLPRFRIDGLRAYHDAPAVNDTINRGELAGARTDSISFICERAGRYQIPEIRFQWWDPESEVLHEEVVPGLEFEVVLNPAFTAADAAVSGTGHTIIYWQFIVLAVGALALILFYGRRVIKLVSRRLEEKRSAREAGEAWAFQRVLVACSGSQASAAYNAINLWLSRCTQLPGGMTLLQLAQRSGIPQLELEAERLQQALLSAQESKWNGTGLGESLKELRSSARQKSEQQHHLPPLNPV